MGTGLNATGKKIFWEMYDNGRLSIPAELKEDQISVHTKSVFQKKIPGHIGVDMIGWNCKNIDQHIVNGIVRYMVFLTVESGNVRGLEIKQLFTINADLPAKHFMSGEWTYQWPGNQFKVLGKLNEAEHELLRYAAIQHRQKDKGQIDLF